jgi:hypothetical protein
VKRRKVIAAPKPESEDDNDAEVASKRHSGKPKKGARSGTSAKPTNNRKSSASVPADGSDGNISALLEDTPQKKGTSGKQSELLSASLADTAGLQTNITPADNGASESELSSVIDEPAPKKKRQKKAVAKEAKKKEGKQKVKQAKAKEESDPQEAEIKRLQGWLVKCGIRKLWHRELAPYDTSKAKINHLKEMLKDAGMDGRYSMDKARQIRERRELEADLEAVQEGARRWGHSTSEDDAEDDGGRPKRKLARGFDSLAFLGDEGEETD